MPIIFIKNIDKHTKLGLYSIPPHECLASKCPIDINEDIKTKCYSRRQEIAAEYLLLYELSKDERLRISHEQSGRPVLLQIKNNNEICKSKYKISISHTKGYVSIIISTVNNVAVDIEYKCNRIHKIKDRFLSSKELNEIKLSEYECIDHKTTRLLLYWCAKETVYKFYSDEMLTFQNMKVEPILHIHKVGEIGCKNLINNMQLNIQYMQTPEYLLTYTIG